MPLPEVALSPGADISVVTVGGQPSPVVIIDNAFTDAQAITDYGRTEAAFTAPVTAYPGLNAHLTPDFLRPVIAALRPVLHGVFGIAEGLPLGNTAYFGLVTLRPEALSPGQALPHVDAVGRGLAMVAYLCDEDQGGTGFYRHRSTGLERLTPENIAVYNAALQFETRNGRPPAYAVGDHPLFELTGSTAARFNRLVMYNCNLLHSGQVNPERLSADPKQGRLTLNAFIAA